MIGPVVLTIPLIVMLGYGLAELGRSRVIGISIPLFTVATLYLVWVPDRANTIAAALRLGTGTDLVAESFIALVILVGLNLHLKIRRQMQVVTALTRQIAISSRQRGSRQASPDRNGSEPAYAPDLLAGAFDDDLSAQRRVLSQQP